MNSGSRSKWPDNPRNPRARSRMMSADFAAGRDIGTYFNISGKTTALTSEDKGTSLINL